MGLGYGGDMRLVAHLADLTTQKSASKSRFANVRVRDKTESNCVHESYSSSMTLTCRSRSSRFHVAMRSRTRSCDVEGCLRERMSRTTVSDQPLRSMR